MCPLMPHCLTQKPSPPSPLLDVFIFRPGAPCLPLCCCGPTCDGEGCINAQVQVCCVVVSAALPPTDEVPAAVTIAGLTLYPKVGCCVPMKEIMDRD